MILVLRYSSDRMCLQLRFQSSHPPPTHTIFIYNAPFKSPEGKVWFKQGRKKTPHKLTKLSLRNYSGLNAAKCILWSPHFSKIIWKKKTLYLIKMITVFSFFKLSISWGPIGMSVFFFFFCHLFTAAACWTAPTAGSHHYHLPSWVASNHYQAALLIFLSYQLANHKPLSLMAWFWVHGYSFCRST